MIKLLAYTAFVVAICAGGVAVYNVHGLPQAGNFHTCRRLLIAGFVLIWLVGAYNVAADEGLITW